MFHGWRRLVSRKDIVDFIESNDPQAFRIAQHDQQQIQKRIDREVVRILGIVARWTPETVEEYQKALRLLAQERDPDRPRKTNTRSRQSNIKGARPRVVTDEVAEQIMRDKLR